MVCREGRDDKKKGPPHLDRRASRFYWLSGPCLRRPPPEGYVIRTSIQVAGLFGLALFIFFIVDSGAEDVGRVMLVLGWRLAPITLFHIIPLSFSVFSWRALIVAASRPRVATVFWVRWIRESINSLLPVAGVGGDFAGVRLLAQQGVPGVDAAASVVVDATDGVATQLVFVLVGVALLVGRSGGQGVHDAAYGLLVGLAVFVALIAGFLRAQHRNLFATILRFAHRLAPGQGLGDLAGGAAAKVDEAIVATYRRRGSLVNASLIRLAGWAAGAGEVWLVLHVLGRPFGLVDSFVLESLSSGVIAAAFLAPGALGAQEGAFVLFGHLFGLPADVALAISLSKRVREIALGVPGLILWQWIEGRRFIGRRARA
jgi:putative membrane protein